MATNIAHTAVAPRKRAQQRLSMPFLFALVLATSAFISLLYLTQTSGVATTGYDIETLESQREQWQIQNQQLRLKIAQLRSLDRVEAEAKRRLDMGPPARILYLWVEPQPLGAERPQDTAQVREPDGPKPGSWWQNLVGLLFP